MRALGVVVALSLLLGARGADACTQCEDRLDLQATAQRADLVVVARRVGKAFDSDSPEDDSATFAPFEIQRILKGSPVAQRIDVALGWWCGFGPEVDVGQSAVLFLEPRRNRYFTVRDGCSVRSLPVLGDKVLVADMALPVDVLAKQLGFAPAAPKQDRRWLRWLIPTLLCLATGLVGFAIGRRRSR